MCNKELLSVQRNSQINQDNKNDVPLSLCYTEVSSFALNNHGEEGL